MNRDDVEKWVRLGTHGGPYPMEEQPYRECPNCGRYKFRYLKTLKLSMIPFFGTSKMRYVEKCSNCRYDTEYEIVGA